MKKKDKGIAVCGLACCECDIFRASNDPAIAQQIVDWFKNERSEKMYGSKRFVVRGVEVIERNTGLRAAGYSNVASMRGD